MSASYLPEISEAEAEGMVAELYDDIREVLGLPLVNLVYRHLAVEPNRLGAAWSQLRPNLTDEAIYTGAQALLESARVDVASLSAAALRVVGAGPPELAAVAATLDAYNHANPRNLIALLALLHGAPGAGRAPQPASARVALRSQILPMAGLDELDEPVLGLLREMAAAVASRGEDTLIPGLLRHLAQYPGLLSLAWTALRPAVEGRAVARKANVVTSRAARLADALPHRVKATGDAETREVVRRFTETIPRMIVVGTALRRALDEALAAGDADPTTRARPRQG